MYLSNGNERWQLIFAQGSKSRGKLCCMRSSPALDDCRRVVAQSPADRQEHFVHFDEVRPKHQIICIRSRNFV
jgi:hypothetical protein